MRKLLVCFVLSVVALVSQQRSSAYDRDAARSYAIKWSGWLVNGRWTGSDPGVGPGIVPMSNTTIYPEYPDDCANFVSQCMIAGGLRFTTSDFGCTQNGYVPGRYCREDGTGAALYAIYNGNRRLYSRIIASSNHFTISMKSARHGGDLQYAPYGSKSHIMWDKVQYGDVIAEFLGTDVASVNLEGDPNVFKHSMFISGVSAIPGNSNWDLKVSAHNNQRCDTWFKTLISDWDTNRQWYVVTLPDAPIVTSRFVWQIRNGNWTGKPWKWGNLWENDSIGSPGTKAYKVVGGDGMAVRLTFDAEMNINSAPSIFLSNYKDYQTQRPEKNLGSFSPVTDDGFNQYGWYVSPSAGSNVRNRTWLGKIYWQNVNFGQMPSVPRVYNPYISIRARAKDGSYNDENNLLDSYEDQRSMKLLRVFIDKSATLGKAKR